MGVVYYLCVLGKSIRADSYLISLIPTTTYCIAPDMFKRPRPVAYAIVCNKEVFGIPRSNVVLGYASQSRLNSGTM